MKLNILLIFIVVMSISSCIKMDREVPPIMTSTNLISVQDAQMTTSSRASMSSTSSKKSITYARIGIFSPEKKFIKDGRLYYKVDNLQSSVNKVRELLTSFGGYFESEVENIRQNQKIIDLRLKVPNKYFESFLDSLTLIIGKYESRSINLRDVTDQYIDTKVRIENKKKVELKYLELLKKANKIADLLAIEENLGKIREEIESAEKRLLKLTKDIEYSTVNVKLYKYSPQFKNLYSNNYSFSDSIKRGWYGMIRAIYSLIASWPLVIIFVIVIILFRNYLRKRKLRNKNTV